MPHLSQKASNHYCIHFHAGGLQQRTSNRCQLLVSLPRPQRRQQEEVPQVLDRKRSSSHPRPQVAQNHHPEGQRRQLLAGGAHVVGGAFIISAFAVVLFAHLTKGHSFSLP